MNRKNVQGNKERDSMRSIVGKGNKTECTFLQGSSSSHTELPAPKRVYRRACREIPGSVRFEEGYFELYDVLALQVYQLFC